MGKRGAKRYRANQSGRGGQRSQRSDPQEIVKQNQSYETYYNQVLHFEDAEKEEFWKALRRELPSSFRFTGSKGQAISVQKILKERYVPDITSIEYEGLPVEPPTPILWFPDQLAWQMSTPKNVVRRFAPFKSFQSFLVSETSIGNINRQEVVSMIPPLLIDIKPGMTVLDLCAAPGSKSAQLIEMLHGGEEARIRKVLGDRKRQEGREMSPHGELLEDEILGEEQHGDWSDDGRSTGLLIANDVDYKRAHMLIHQMKRLNSPNLIVTNHDATMYPSIKIPVDAASDGKPRHRYLKFDRILADVPCSGDGTCRKNPSVWKNWTPGNALGLFSIQVRILVRALQMTKTGGRVVYSTCSMNPVENEAVVASAIERCEGVSKIEVVDCSDRLPGLKREPGLHEWKVMDKSTKIWSSWSEVEREKELHGEEGLGKLVEGMFPRNDFPFDRCMRVYPHLQDTGGFFIAVLEKKAETRAKPDNENRKVHTTPSVIAIVNEIEAKSANGIDSNLGIEALDNFMAPREGANAQDVSPAARQNREVVQDQAVDISKHELYDEADDFASSKRLRTRDGLVEPAPRGAEDRQVHWPPPPGAQLEVSRPEAMKLTEPTSSQQGSPYKAKANEKQQFEEPFKYLDPDHRELQIIYDFYQLSANFPRNRYMVRNATGNPTKTIYYTSALARNILTTNEGSGLKTVHCGVKMFVKQDVQKEGVCKWRMQTEGLPLVEASVGEERVVRLTKRETLRKLLVEMFPKVDGSGWKDLAEIGARVRDITMGCCVLRVEKGEGQDEFCERMVLPLWRSLHSINLMLPKEERKAMLLRLYNDNTPLQDHSKDRFIPTAQSKVIIGEDAGKLDNDLDADNYADTDSVASEVANTIPTGLGQGALRQEGTENVGAELKEPEANMGMSIGT